jgi:threonine synthase
MTAIERQPVGPRDGPAAARWNETIAREREMGSEITRERIAATEKLIRPHIRRTPVIEVGSLMFPIAQRHVAEAVLVEDEAIRDAQRRLWDVLRIATKPGGAAALAALLSGRYRPAKDERVAVLLCGANTTAVDFDR